MTSGATTGELRCHDCHATELELAAGYEKVGRVTSDCKPWPAGGRLALCRGCGLVQTVVSSTWQAECEAIYGDYTIYYQSGGSEQPVFDRDSGAGQARSEAVLRALFRQGVLSATGRWLDVGCGNGAMLRACSRGLPGWTFCGAEVHDRYRAAVESIPRMEQLVTGPLTEIAGEFDLISLVHVVEHIPGPRAYLERLGTKLKPNGLLLLEVPDCRANFFMLAVADHCSHFSLGMLASVTSAAGYTVTQAAEAWVPKEITVVACKSAAAPRGAPGPPSMLESEQVFRGWQTLARVRERLLSHRGSERLGILGTAIAATWLDAQSGGVAGFFVDEDPNRIGKAHRGRPVYSPANIPVGAEVFVALPPVLGESVGARLRALRPEVRFIVL
jgi:hypothetical protein